MMHITLITLEGEVYYHGSCELKISLALHDQPLVLPSDETYVYNPGTRLWVCGSISYRLITGDIFDLLRSGDLEVKFMQGHLKPGPQPIIREMIRSLGDTDTAEHQARQPLILSS